MAPPTFHSGLRALNDEFSYRANDVEGVLPAWLRGTFFRNGPGRLEVGGQHVGHWFDGDGLICKFSFRDDGVHVANRYVRTPKYVRETALNRIDFRGFGTRRPGGILANCLRAPANPANTSVIWHGNHLFALNEGGRPFALDPVTLQTRGEYDFDGQLTPLNMFSAHGKIHPRTGDYINFGMGILGLNRKGMQPGLMLYRVTPDGVLRKKVAIPVDVFPFCHDFALTDRHAIFMLGSIRAKQLGAILLGIRTFAESVTYDASVATQVLVVDLDTFEVVQRTVTDPGAVVHFGNAWEDADAFHIDAMSIDNFDANAKLMDIWHADKLGGGQFLRYKISKRDGAVSQQRVVDVECEFPQWHLRKTAAPSQLTYAAAVDHNGEDSFFNAILKVNSQTGQNWCNTLPAGCFASEPMFAPRPGGSAEDDGVLLDVIYNANTEKSELWVLDAADISHLLAKVLLPHHIPHQFHGFFTPQLF